MLVEVVMAYTNANGGARELKARPWQLQYDGLGTPTRFLCVQRGQRVEEAETNSIVLISKKVKHKVRNNGDSRSLVAKGRGGGGRLNS